MTSTEITADLNAISTLIDRLNTLSAGVYGYYGITLEPELTLTRDGEHSFTESSPGGMLRYLERRFADLQGAVLAGRFQLLRFGLVRLDEVDRIAIELEPLKALYALGIDPGACTRLHLCRESAAYPLIFRLLDGTPLLQLVEDDGSIKVQLPGALIVALEKYVHH